ncbi:MFS transporter [Embleya scabrispora]|uniref:MFS transporter n=1 Tax=Embleya scabrispora TaxID=159449 RepID=UPI000367C127|nr:MFS transporter [Embleya scabrispora]MYS80942.1 MFS transporter [Streptomyces sp. SID5474]
MTGSGTSTTSRLDPQSATNTSTTSAPSPTPAPHATVAFAVLGTVQATLIFTITAIGVPLPDIGREFGLDSADLVLLSAAYGLPFSGLLLFGGRLADRYGGRPMFGVGLLVFGLASTIAAFAPGFAVLIAVRFGQGLGAALTAPAAMAVLRAVYPEPGAYRRAMATWGGLSVLGAAFGNLASGVLTTWVSWRWMFAIPVTVAVVALLLTPRLLPNGKSTYAGPTAHPSAEPGGRPGLDPLGAILATVGITLAGYGLTVTGDHAWTSAAVLAPLGVGAMLLAAFAAVERRVADPLLPPGFVRDPRRILGLVGVLLAATGTGLVSFLISLHLQQDRAWSPLATAGAFVPFTLALIAAGRAAGPLIGRYGPGRITVAGLLIGGAGLLLLTRLDEGARYAPDLLPGLILLPVGAALIFAGTAVLTTRDVPAHRAGLAGGVLNTAMELGPTVGLAALMSVAATRADAIAGYAWAFGTAGAVFLLAAVVASPLVRDRDGDQEHGSAREPESPRTN